jgi:hypothetical protein
MSGYRRSQIQKHFEEMGQVAPEKMLTEVADKFEWLDRQITGVGFASGTNERLMEVMTSADFTFAIMEFVQRRTLPGYQRKRFGFEPLVMMDTVPNFLPVTRYQNRAGVDDLEYVASKGQARPGSVDDGTKRQWQVWHWAKQYDFAHQALVNDDLGYFEDVATKMGESARRTLEKYVSRYYTNAITIARLVALGALFSTTGRLTTARVSTARMAFNQRTDARTEPINASLVYIVGHSGLADTAATILNSTQVAELATNAVNVVSFTWIEDPYIVGTAPNLPWYGFTGLQNGIVPYVLARQQGRPGPLILRKKSDIEAVTSMLGSGRPVAPIMGDFESGNVVMMVSDVWGTFIDGTEGNMVDNRGSYYSSGTAP